MEEAREEVARLQAVLDQRSTTVEQGAAAIHQLESSTKQARACVRMLTALAACWWWEDSKAKSPCGSHTVSLSHHLSERTHTVLHAF